MSTEGRVMAAHDYADSLDADLTRNEREIARIDFQNGWDARGQVTRDREAIKSVIQSHEIDLFAWSTDHEKFEQLLGEPDANGGRTMTRSFCKCGEILDNDAGDDGWPSMAAHQAAAILALFNEKGNE